MTTTYAAGTDTKFTDPALPNYMRPEVRGVSEDLTLVHDLLAGTRRMHEQALLYIRKWSDEEQPVYKIRREGETLFEGLGRTLSAATGMLFAKAPQVTWNASETAMTDHWANLDAAGTAGIVLIKRFSEAAIRDGLGAILVDHTPPPPASELPAGTVTDRVAKALGLRPTWALYARGQVINWRTAVIQGQRKLTMAVLHECADVDDGEFGTRTVERYRVLKLILTPNGWQATWRLWEAIKADAAKIEDFTIAGDGGFKNKDGVAADFLPLSIAYAGRTDAPMTATIPLMGVAWANLAHWQLSTDLRFYRALAAFPQPVVIGTLAPDAQTGAPGKLRVGPMVGVHLTAEQGASFEWKELQGTSMEQLEKGIAEKLGQMSKLGMAFLQQDKRVMETAEAKRLDATAENSTLATAAQGIEDACNAALEHHAWYLGIEKAGAPVITISRDYESTAMDAQTMVAYVTAVKDAGLPVKLLLEAWQVGGRIPPDTDLEELELEMLANAQAAADHAAQAAADAAAGGGTPPVKRAA